VSSSRRSIRAILPLLGILFCTAPVVACGSDPATEFEREGRPPRLQRAEPVAFAWNEELRIGGDLNDTILFIPLHVVANSAGVFVVDIAANRLVHFGHDGTLKWMFGVSGAGPGEFRSPRDLRLDAVGRIWVTDSENRRSTIITPSGELDRLVSLQSSETVMHVLPLADHTAIAITMSLEQPIVRIDSTGEVLSQHKFPWERYASLSRLTTQFLAAHDPMSSQWFSAFSVGDGFFAFNGSEWDGYEGWYVERVKFPMAVVRTQGDMTVTQLARPPQSAAIAVTLSPSFLYVLFGGSGPHRGKVVDRYHRDTGKYESSFLLPSAAYDMYWYDGGLYLLRGGEAAELVYLRTSDGPLP
jgi:hypothetical protein